MYEFTYLNNGEVFIEGTVKNEGSLLWLVNMMFGGWTNEYKKVLKVKGPPVSERIKQWIKDDMSDDPLLDIQIP